MHTLPLLAHGALGAFDEVIFIGVAAIFLAMMGVSWVKSRNTKPDLESTEVQDTDAPSPTVESPAADRFRLE